MVGTQSKLGKRYPVKAFETGERVTIEYLNGYLMDKSKAVTDFHYKSDLSLAEARKSTRNGMKSELCKGSAVSVGISKGTYMIGGCGK